MAPAKLSVLGVKIDPLTIESAIDTITARGWEQPPVYVVKPYVEFFQDEYRDILNQAWLSLPDGVALQWAAHFQQGRPSLVRLITTLGSILVAPQRIRDPIPDKFAGTNFTWPLLERCAERGKRVYLVGSPIGHPITHTKAVLTEAIEGLEIVGTMPGRDESGVFSEELERALIQDLSATKPDIVLLGLGFPRQEGVMSRLVTKLEGGVLIGEGGTFDYELFGGNRKKAPRFMQRIGLEWLWRLLLEPSRLPRQIAIPRFIWRVYRFTNQGETQYHKGKPKKHKRNTPKP